MRGLSGLLGHSQAAAGALGDKIEEGYVAEVTPEQQAGIESVDDLAPIYLCINFTKAKELEVQIKTVQRAASATYEQAGRAVRWSSELGHSLAKIDRFLSSEEAETNVFGHGMILGVDTSLTKALQVSDSDSDSDSGGAAGSRRRRTRSQKKVQHNLTIAIIATLENDCLRAQRLSNVLRSRVKVMSCAVLAGQLGLAARLINELLEKNEKGAKLDSLLKTVKQAAGSMRLLWRDCAGNATKLFFAIVKANAKPEDKKALAILSAANTALSNKGNTKAALEVWLTSWPILLRTATKFFDEAAKALGEAYARNLVLSGHGISISGQTSVLLLAGAACGLERLAPICAAHNKFSGKEPEVCEAAIEKVLNFAAAVIPLEMSALARSGTSPLLKELQPRITLNLQAGMAMRQEELAASTADVIFYKEGLKKLEELHPAARILVVRRDKQASRRRSRASTQPSTPSDEEGGLVFESGTDMEDSAASLSLEAEEVTKKFDLMSLKASSSS